MPTQRLLYLTPHQIAAYRWHGGDLVEEGAFDASEAGGAFSAYLRTLPTALFSLVTNVAEEGYQIETIPYLTGSDRRTVLNRRLGQLFMGATLSTALSLGYPKARRKNEKLLLMALTNNAALEPWINALRMAESRLAGAWSLPLLSGEILARLRVPAMQCVLITVQDNTLRQSYFDQGHLCFSRVSPLNNSSVAGIAQTIAAESAKLHQYLVTQRLLARTATLDAHLLLPPQFAESIAATLVGSDILRFQIHDLVALARLTGLKTLPADPRADLLFLHLAATKAPRQQLADEGLRKHFRLWQTARMIRAIGLVASAACLLFAARTWVVGDIAREEAARYGREAAAIDARYQAIVATFPPAPTSNDNLRQLIGQYDRFQQVSRGPAPLFRRLGAALDQAPQIELDSLDWSLGDAPTAAPGSDLETLQIKGRIALAGGNPRQLLATFDHFVELLRSDGRLQVMVIQQPFDVASGKSLKGNASLETDTPRTFALTISQRSRPS